MMSDLDTLANFVKDNFPQDAHMPDLQVSVAPSSVACPEGKVIMVLPGNGTELERTKCGKFQRELLIINQTLGDVLKIGDLQIAPFK